MQCFRQKCNQPTNSKINYYSYRLQQYKKIIILCQSHTVSRVTTAANRLSALNTVKIIKLISAPKIGAYRLDVHYTSMLWCSYSIIQRLYDKQKSEIHNYHK